MNNGKVRIYELSKELNLENKELLAICDQLNIAVKSHSSTITESDAERIRSQAEKLTTTLGLSKQHGTNSKGSGNGASAPSKPQILEIRSKPKPPTNSSSANSVPEPPNNNLGNQYSAADDGATNQNETNLVSPKEQVAPTAPVSPNQPTSVNQSVSVSNTDNSASNSSSESNKTALSKPEKLVSPKSKPEKPEAAPELAAPPARPSLSKPSSGLDNRVVEKPVLKRDRTQSKPQRNKPSGDKGESNGVPVGKTPRPSAPVSKVDKPQKPKKASPGGSPNSSDVARPRKQVRQDSSAPPSVSAPLRPPTRPAKPSIGDSSTDIDEKDDDDVVEEVVELKRPTPPRLPRGQKKRSKQEEAIDEAKEAAKAAKAPKNKRLKPMAAEDDFDVDLLDEDEAADTIKAAVSNAIVRRSEERRVGKECRSRWSPYP